MALQSHSSPEHQKQLLLEKNTALANKHTGERCFILATGPSIKDQNLAFLKNERCIAVSNFFVHPDFNLINPEYYCIAPYHLPLTEEAWQAWMDDVASKVKMSHFFFGINDLKRNMIGDRFSGNPISFIDFNGNIQDTIDYGIALSKPVFPIQSVSIMALQVAIYMGFKDIYLLGCDHDWILHMYESRHFYDEELHAFTRISGKDLEWKQTDLENECRSYINLWQQYKVLRHIASKADITIFNATKGGMLDVFPQAVLEDIVSIFKSSVVCQGPVPAESHLTTNEQGEMLYSSGDISGARALFSQAVEKNEKPYIAHNNLGVLFWQEGDFTKSVVHLNTAIKQNHTYAPAVINYTQVRKYLAMKNEDIAQMVATDVMFKPWHLLSSSILVDRPPWIQISEHDVVRANGNKIKGYLTWELREYAIVVALTEEGIPLICQYRQGIQAPNFDFPGGYLELNEDPLIAAKRELLEETGLGSNNWDHLGSLLLDDTRGKARAHFFLAHDAKHLSHQSPDEAEEVLVTYHKLEQLLGMIDESQIDSLPSVTAVLLALRKMR